jgi:hypothetical protein
LFSFQSISCHYRYKPRLLQTHVIFENERKWKIPSYCRRKICSFCFTFAFCHIYDFRETVGILYFFMYLSSKCKPFNQAAVPLAAYDEPALRALPPPSSCSLLNSSPSPPQQQQHSLFPAVEMPAPPRPFTDPATAATAVAAQNHHHHHRADQAAYRQDVITC